jgi:hypothetical protein
VLGRDAGEHLDHAFIQRETNEGSVKNTDVFDLSAAKSGVYGKGTHDIRYMEATLSPKAGGSLMPVT